MRVGELEDRLLSALLRHHGGTRRRWRLVLGPVRLHDPATHPHCNWSLAPAGTAAENEAVEGVSDDLRERYPIVAAD